MSTRYKFSFTTTDFQDMLAEFQQQVGPQGTGANYRLEGNEHTWELQNSFGTWSGQLLNLRDGLDLSLDELNIQEPLCLIAEAQIEPLFCWSFCVAGGSMTKFPDRGVEYSTCENEVYAGFLPGITNVVSEFAAGQKSTFVQVSANPRLFEMLAEASPDPCQSVLAQMLADTQAGFHGQMRKTTPAMMIVLHQILNCPYYGLTKRFYLESKTLELVALQLNQLSDNRLDLATTSVLKADDVTRIYLARDILIRNLENPPSLLILAKQAGINSLKLKQGFRQIFNTTVFGYLYSYRMEEARRLLEIGGLNVTQVAQRVGYAHPGKFSAAFKKKFGISPKVLKSD